MDQYNDPCGTQLEKIAAAYRLPVDLSDKTFHNRALDKVASHKFALPEARLFPVHTPEDTLLSAAFFLTKEASFGKEKDEEIHDVIKAASIAHGVVQDYQRLAKEVYSCDLMKTASASDEYALDCTIYDERILAYPINSPDELQKSAEVFINECDRLSAKLKKEAAYNLTKKAEYYGVDLKSAKIDAYAGLRGVDLEKAAEFMLFRAKRSPNESLKTVMVKAAQAMITLPEGQLDFDKIASFIDHYDDVVGTKHLVNKGTIPDGYSTIFNKDLIEKTAGIKLAGKEFSEEDFKNLPIEKFAEALGEDFVKAASSGGSFDYSTAMDIASTLPLPEAKMLSEYIGGHEKRANWEIGDQGFAKIDINSLHPKVKKAAEAYLSAPNSPATRQYYYDTDLLDALIAWKKKTGEDLAKHATKYMDANILDNTFQSKSFGGQVRGLSKKAGIKDIIHSAIGTDVKNAIQDNKLYDNIVLRGDSPTFKKKSVDKMKELRSKNLKTLGKGTAVAAGTLAAGYGAKKLYDKYKSKEHEKKAGAERIFRDFKPSDQTKSELKRYGKRFAKNFVKDKAVEAAGGAIYGGTSSKDKSVKGRLKSALKGAKEGARPELPTSLPHIAMLADNLRERDISNPWEKSLYGLKGAYGGIKAWAAKSKEHEKKAALLVKPQLIDLLKQSNVMPSPPGAMGPGMPAGPAATSLPTPGDATMKSGVPGPTAPSPSMTNPKAV